MEDRNYILDKMKGRVMTPDQFNYEQLWAPPLYSLLTVDDIDQLHKIATSIRYSGRPVEKLDAIDKILRARGFRKFGGGTNRVVYKFLEDDRFILKVATSEVALDDSPREFINQMDLEPFCCKCFEVSPCGTVGLFERVRPITSREEFLSVADMAYDLITNILIGESVMDDIGTQYFMNYGVRAGFGLVIIDYTFRYKLDGNKLYCNNLLPDGARCGGVIDYDEGFNRLSCTKCGRVYKAMELRKAIDESIVIQKGGSSTMKVALIRGDTTTYNDTEDYIDTAPKLVSKKKNKKSKVGHLKIVLRGRKSDVIDLDEEPEDEHTLNVRGTIVHAPKKEKENREYDDYDDDDMQDTLNDISRGLHPDDDADIADENDDYEDDDYRYEESEEDDDDDDDDVQSTLKSISKGLHPDDDADIADENDDYEDEEGSEYSECVECSGDIIKSSEVDGDEDNAYKAIIIYNEDGEAFADEDGNYYLISELMGYRLDDLAIIEKSAYDAITKELEDARSEVDRLRAELDKKDDINLVAKGVEKKVEKKDNESEDDIDVDIEDDGLEYFIDDEGVPRWKTNHNVYKKPIPGFEDKYDTSSKLIPKKEEESVPVGAAPPKNKKKSNHPYKEYGDESEKDYFDPNKIKNNGKKNKKR